MTAATKHEPQQQAAAQPQERKPSLLDQILESSKTQDRIIPFLKTDTDYYRVASAVRLYAQMHPDTMGCTPASIQAAIIKVAQWGLEIGETAHLVPFNVNVAPKGQPAKWEKHLTPIADYKGLIQLMLASGVVRHIEPPRLVYENETFKETLGSHRTLLHEPIHDRKARGKMKGVYVVFWVRFQIRDWLYMPIEDVEDIRQTYSKQHKTGEMPGWYPKKTVIRQVGKYMPRDPRLARAFAVIADEAREEFGKELEEVIAETQRKREADEDGVVTPDLRLAPTTDEAPHTQVGRDYQDEGDYQDDSALADD